ncbi:sulfotransferase family 2 domain-containing protein [Vreelandella aquamarina]|uniref:Sulfotransferase family protein n=1 Tax=Vreelandella aquamarina TaxID=77097 RepID=A0A857GPB4_9GAMM|nr:sulfotransferase family 2 domain-containing protein [Halomonas meridiana]QHD50384.1 hypothetical protein CTT34_12155 [Halomonas meridiana]
MNSLFFVHVPKTAGTSFRKAAELFFGSEKVVYDYSPTSVETSDVALNFVYEIQDFLLFYNELKSLKVKLICGHVSAGKYIDFFGSLNTLTFLREPVQRIVSEYYHFVRHNNYKGDLPSFYRKPQFINRQSKMLQGVPVEALGFVGLTERYEQGLDILNQAYGTNIQSVSMNMGRKDKAAEYELPEEQLNEIRSLNEDDLQLYDHAKRLFLKRETLFKQGRPYVHGAIQQQSNKSISGWAWWQGSDDSVELAIEVDGETVATVYAKDLRPGLLRLGLPRRGYVGFHHNFAEPLSEDAVVTVRVAKTGQCIS